ncbi:MAG: ParB N-terminal domain-containing protein [Bacteroidales bacterium]|nr:ParB N-terminal domain-containing protein [Bacteroidales bacterium]
MEGTILKTSDYSIFRRLQGNRAVDERRVKGLVESIQKIGWISNPIIVNEKMEVIDGQGRLEALKRLCMPVEYHIVKDARLQDCRVMNSNNKSWRPMDYIESYSESGNMNYRRVWGLMKHFGVSLDTVLYSVGVENGGRRGKEIKEGELTFTESDWIKASYALNIRKKYLKVMDRFGGRRATRDKVVFYLVEYGRTHDNVDHDEIVRALESCDPRDIYAQNFERLLESVQKACNYNKKKRENKLYFYEEYRLDNKL